MGVRGPGPVWSGQSGRVSFENKYVFARMVFEKRNEKGILVLSSSTGRVLHGQNRETQFIELLISWELMFYISSLVSLRIANPERSLCRLAMIRRSIEAQ